MKINPLCVLLLLLTCLAGLGCASVTDADAKADPSATPDPFVGEYIAFRNGHEYKGDHWPITITRQGEVYRISLQPETAFYLNPHKPTELYSKDVGFIRQIDKTQDGLVMMQGFGEQMPLYKGAGPAGAKAEPNAVGKSGLWEFRLHVRSPNTTAERLGGELLRNDRRYRGYPGDIVYTPLGKFMYLGDPGTEEFPTGFDSGWLNELTGKRALFNKDGSLTEIGKAYRLQLKKDTRQMIESMRVRNALWRRVLPSQLHAVVAGVKPGMDAGAVHRLIGQHLTNNYPGNRSQWVGEDQQAHEFVFEVRGQARFTVRFQKQADGSYRVPKDAGELEIEWLDRP